MTDMESFTFAQLSDPHLTSLQDVRAGELINKRIFGYLSWRFHRRTEHRSEILSSLIQDLQVKKPDHIVITGDLTHLGLPSEFQEAKKWLDGIGPTSKITVVPGNHETYVATAWEDTFAKWVPYMASDQEADSGNGVARDPQDFFPSVRVRRHVAFIGLSSARPSAPFLAVGSLTDKQLSKLEELLVRFGREQLFRVVLIHHPPLPGTVKWRKSLTNAHDLQAILVRCGAELVLHGHAHSSLMNFLPTSSASIPVIGVPSASAVGAGASLDRRARYHLYRLSNQVGAWDLRVSVYVYSLEKRQFLFEHETQLLAPQRCEV